MDHHPLKQTFKVKFMPEIKPGTSAQNSFAHIEKLIFSNEDSNAKVKRLKANDSGHSVESAEVKKIKDNERPISVRRTTSINKKVKRLQSLKNNGKSVQKNKNILSTQLLSDTIPLPKQYKQSNNQINLSEVKLCDRKSEETSKLPAIESKCPVHAKNDSKLVKRKNYNNNSKVSGEKYLPHKTSNAVNVKNVSRVKNKLSVNYNGLLEKVNNSKSKSRSSKVKQAKSENKKFANQEGKINESSNSELSDWENVDEVDFLLSKDNSDQLLSKNVQIELDAPNILGIRHRKKNSMQEQIENHIRLHFNRFVREVFINEHKVHLLLLVAHGFYVNSLLNSENLMASALSIVTEKNAYPPKRLNLQYLEKFVGWFCKKIEYKYSEVKPDSYVILQRLFNCLEEREACLVFEYVCLFVVIARSLGMTVRIVFNLQPVSWKPPCSALAKPQKDKGQPSIKTFENNNILKTVIKTMQNKNPGNKQCEKKISPKRKRTALRNSDYDDDDDCDTVKKTKKSLKSRKCSQTDAVTTSDKKKKFERLTNWAEVYVEEEEKWICVDVLSAKIHCGSEIEGRAQHPVAYVLAYNNDQTVKDVTKRYVSSWLPYKNKLRCDSEWWEKSLSPFLSTSKRDLLEEHELDENLRMKPLPKTLSEFKNHPLYALLRHLLKFEAIYPPNATPIGFFKGEPVYSRSDVKVLHGREFWIREAKVIKVGEEPYKIVKARPKWNKSNGKVEKDRILEIFGNWQTEDYVPPIAKNGKVPKNEYGNVELFKPCMLPIGCVHISINGLHRVAQKLNIDCAPAMLGFDYHKGLAHPVTDGVVVCEENKDMLLDAWKQVEEHQKEKAEAKRIQQIYDNWKCLIRGILVKNKVTEKYGKENDKKQEKKKIRQKDLDEVSHTSRKKTVELKIDLSKSAVEFIEMRNNLTQHEESEEEEETNEEMSQKIQKVLEWGMQESYCNPLLSDESDDELTQQNKILQKKATRRPVIGKTRGKGLNKTSFKNVKYNEGIESDISSNSEVETAISELPERQSVTRNSLKVKTYKESSSEVDISLSESDFEDKTYFPTEI